MIPKKKYEANQDHIERTVTTYLEHQKKETDFYWQYPLSKDKETLISLFEKPLENRGKRIVLLSVAGFGKTEELNNLAAKYSNDGSSFFPIKKLLKNYAGESIEDLLAAAEPSWREIAIQNLLLLFDGLDEIKEQYISIFKSKLNSFLENNPLCNALVTSRFNFYDIKQEQLDGFDVHILQQLTYKDTKDYITKKLGDKENAFRSKLEENKFTEYINNPYYLTRLVRFYSGNGEEFPKNKSELFRKILFDRIEKDEARFDKEDLKEKLLPSATKVAFCMTLSGKNFLSTDELQAIIPDTKDRENLKLFCIFNQNEEALGSWSFEHNNLREYLCASQLREFSFDKIKEIITYSFNRDKLLPRFLNTISFLFEIIKNDSPLFIDLFNWLISTQPELFVRFEKEQIKKEKRQEIFKNIFEYYKQKQLPLYTSPNFSIAELAEFTDVDKPIVDYLDNILRNNCTVQTAYNCLDILAETKRMYIYKDTLSALCLFILQSVNFEIGIKVCCLRSLETIVCKDKPLFENIFLTENLDVSNFFVRKQLVHILKKSEYFEAYVDFILGSISIFEKGQEEISYSGSNEVLIQLILKLESIESVKKILRYCLTNKKIFAVNALSSTVHFKPTDVKTLLNITKTFVALDTSLIRIVYRICVSIEQHYLHDDKLLPIFRDFFYNTCNVTIAFKKLYKIKDRQWILLQFANEESIDYLIQQYTDGKIIVNDLFYVGYRIRSVSNELYDYFIPKFNAVTNNQYLNKEIDYRKIEAEYKEKNQLMLLDRQLFLKEASAIFDVIPKEVVTFHDINDYQNNALITFQNSIVKEKIHRLTLDSPSKTTSKAEFVKLFSIDSFWDSFVLETVKSFLESKNDIIVKPELLQIAKDWLKIAIIETDFTNSIIDNSNGYYTYFPNIEFIKEFYLLIDIEIEDFYLLNLLQSDYSGVYHDSSETGVYGKIIAKVKDKRLLKERVLQNIRSGNLSQMVLFTHFRICNDLSYKECLEDLHEAIALTPKDKDHEKRRLTDYYLNLGGEIKDFIPYLEKPEFEREEDHFISWQWYLLEKFMDVEPDKVAGILLKIFFDPLQGKNGKTESIKLLLQMGRKEGLELWSSYVKEYKNLPFDNDMKPIDQFVRVHSNKLTADLLLDTLDYSYKNKIFHNRFYESIQGCIYSALILTAIDSYENYDYIKGEIDSLVLKYSTEKFVKDIRIFRQNIDIRFYEKYSYEISIETTISWFEKLVSVVSAIITPQIEKTVVILTAILEEYNAVREHLENIVEKTIDSDTYEVGTFKYLDSIIAKIIIRECGAGNIKATLETERAIKNFKPDMILFVGIAGSRKPNDFSHGSVIFAEKIFYYEKGKATKELFLARPESSEPTYDLFQKALHIRRSNEWKALIKGSYDENIKCNTGTIASGEQLIDHYSSIIGNTITNHYNDAAVVEMEGYGFLKTTRSQGAKFNNLIAGVVRGISDVLERDNEVLLDSDRRPEHAKEMASDTAAAFAFWLIYKTFGVTS